MLTFHERFIVEHQAPKVIGTSQLLYTHTHAFFFCKTIALYLYNGNLRKGDKNPPKKLQRSK